MVDELDFYRKMLTIRLLETELQKLCLAGLAGDLHFNKGQEAISVGTCAALAPEDYIVTHHRTIAQTYSKGTELKPLVAEILGRKGGTNNGLAGEMHFNNPAARHLFSFQLVGTCVPVAAGVAWAVKNYLRERQIVGCFFGDGSTSNAQFHEGLNIASVKKLPVLLICENNGLAGNIRKATYLPTESVTERASAYGIESCRIDGNDVLGVYKTVEEVSRKVREESHPYLIEMMTTRLCWHKQGQPDARSDEELQELAKLDPIPRLGRRLADRARERVEAEVNQEVQDVIRYGLSLKYPDASVIPQLQAYLETMAVKD